MCMKQEAEPTPTIHQSLGGPVWKFVHVYSAGTHTVVDVHGVLRTTDILYVCVRAEQTGGPPQFSLSIILHTRHTCDDMPERVSISSVFMCAGCLPEECSSLYLYVCLVITYALSHTFTQADGAPLYLQLLKRGMTSLEWNHESPWARHWEAPLHQWSKKYPVDRRYQIFCWYQILT